nr:uncharacterized protein LOC109184184 [Ipomoea trifida]
MAAGVQLVGVKACVSRGVGMCRMRVRQGYWCASKRCKEKATDTEVDEVTPLKRHKQSSPQAPRSFLTPYAKEGNKRPPCSGRSRPRSPPAKQSWGWRPTKSMSRSLRTLTLELISAVTSYSRLPNLILLILQLSHTTTDLLCRTKATENLVRKEVEPLKKSVIAKEARNKELKEKVKELEERVVRAKKEATSAKDEATEVTEKITDHASLAAFLCRDRATAESFFRAFIHKKPLDDKDFATVLEILPEDVPDPDTCPYADPLLV